jgi:sirohydrochlorin cobaltochelatase
VRQLRITPMFLGTGKHAREDIPRLVAELQARHPGVQVEVQASVGEDPRVTALLAQIASE